MKKPPTPIEETKKVPPTREELIDELGEVQRRLSLKKPTLTPDQVRYGELKALAETWCPADHPAGENLLIQGNKYQLEFKPREHERKFKPGAAGRIFWALITAKVDPLEIFTLTLAAVKKHLGKDYLEESTTNERTGERPWEIVAKQPATAAAPEPAKKKVA